MRVGLCLALSAGIHVFSLPASVGAFGISSTLRGRPSTTILAQATTTISDPLSPEDAFDLERFQRRQQALEDEARRPPHPSLGPQQVVQSVLTLLRQSPHFFDYDPLKPRPHPGVSVLWDASTDEWRQTMAAMVGMGNSTQEPIIVVPALGRFLARPQQQFAILMGMENRDYWIDFPTDVIEWSDEEAWLECRLRDGSSNDELLVVLGWTLTREHANDAWYIHSFDWQDFRNDYRPGIGREEWERICG
ncbi:expressed unknown protein [Seminavis robusta]|uniref:Uncharacterized protein n=1 Tax=Seminavis robusta TaxID=568900 RepID=A0A9N8E8V9_9STRA|nr:expressed unknown protein [Seminavis robusta]|eukprot:Sro751_g197060.1 n/a (248) ;mRNA; r:15990-16733